MEILRSLLFDEKTAPNHHKLAREFVLFDNFYVNGGRSRGRPQLVYSGHRAGLRAEDVAEQLWRSPQATMIMKAAK